MDGYDDHVERMNGVSCVRIRRLSALLALCLLATACGGPSGSSKGNTTYATVNGEKITEAQVSARRNLIAFLDPTARSQLKGHQAVVNITQELVNEALLAQAAAKAKTKVTSADIGSEKTLLTQDISSLYPSAAQAKKAMKTDHLTQNDLNAYAKLSALFQSYLTANVKPPAVTQAEIKNYYQTNKAQFQTPEEYDVRHILVKTKALAETIESDLKTNPSQFATLAKKYSIDTGSAKNGGDLGYAPLSNYVSAFSNAVAKLKVGQISPIVHSQYGYHVIQLLGVKPASTQPLTQVSAEIQAYLSQQSQQQAIQTYLQKLRQTAKVKVTVPKTAT